MVAMQHATGGLMSDVEREMRKGAFRAAVGRVMFCQRPGCERLLDVTSAIESALYRDPPDPRQLQIPGAEDQRDWSHGPELRGVKVLCAACWEACYAARGSQFERMVADQGLRVEVTDGRVLFPKAVRAPKLKSASVRNPIRKSDVQVGGSYMATVSGRWVEVKIGAPFEGTLGGVRGRGWRAINVSTGREIWIKSAARLSPMAKVGGGVK